MKPTDFEEQNAVLAKNQPQYRPLPVHVVGDPSGTVISRWELTDEEKQQILETGVIWCSAMTFGHPLQPQLLSTEKPFVDGNKS